MLYRIAYVIAWVYFKLTNFWTVTGYENIPEGKAIFAANHTCWSDPVFLGLALKVKNRPQYMTKIEIVQSKLFGKAAGKLLKSLGVFFVDRKNSALMAMKHGIMTLKKGGKLAIFPEGTRVKKGQHVEAKGGTIMLAHKTEAPVIPVYITPGPKKIFTKVHVVFGKPVVYHFEGKPESWEYEECAEKLMQTVFALAPV